VGFSLAEQITYLKMKHVKKRWNTCAFKTIAKQIALLKANTYCHIALLEVFRRVPEIGALIERGHHYNVKFFKRVEIAKAICFKGNFES